MPTIPWLKLLQLVAPYIKEILFGRYKLVGYFSERKLVAFLLFSLVLVFGAFIFMSEQAIGLTKKLVARDRKIYELSTMLAKTAEVNKDLDKQVGILLEKNVSVEDIYPDTVVKTIEEGEKSRSERSRKAIKADINDKLDKISRDTK